MAFFKKIVNNARKPEGFMGKMMIKGMNLGHAKLSDWGMDQFPDSHPQTLIDLGCGGGRNVGELLKRYPEATVTGLDYAPLSVEKTQDYNHKAIKAGRCQVQKGDATNLKEIANDAYDLVTAFETIYFWSDILQSFKEAYRILREGGHFLIVNESDGTNEESLRYEKLIEGMTNYTIPELVTLLKAAGFQTVSSNHHETHPWIIVTAHKSSL